jgi:hypothetical protein
MSCFTQELGVWGAGTHTADPGETMLFCLLLLCHEQCLALHRSLVSGELSCTLLIQVGQAAADICCIVGAMVAPACASK